MDAKGYFVDVGGGFWVGLGGLRCGGVPSVVRGGGAWHSPLRVGGGALRWRALGALRFGLAGRAPSMIFLNLIKKIQTVIALARSAASILC